MEVEPVAGEGKAQRVTITNATATALRGMLAVALIMVAVFTAIRWLASARQPDGAARA